MNPVAELTSAAFVGDGLEVPAKYIDSLQDATASKPPPFGTAWYGQRYREVATNPDWLANSLVGNAAKEGEGAQKLWDLACRTADPQTSEAIRIHAIDEARHARMYIAMLDLTFPGAVSDELRPTLRALSPGYSSSSKLTPNSPSSTERVLDELVQINIGEIRTRIHQMLLRPMILAHCQKERHEKLSILLSSILADETRHVAYTADILEASLNSDLQDFVRTTMRGRLAEFNEITLDEVDGRTFDGA